MISSKPNSILIPIYNGSYFNGALKLAEAIGNSTEINFIFLFGRSYPSLEQHIERVDFLAHLLIWPWSLLNLIRLWIETLLLVIIKGLGKENESDEITQRTKVYYRYLQNNPIDGWEIDRYSNEIYLNKI